MIAPTRRGFLTSMLALAAAPAIVRASSLMTVRPLPKSFVVMGTDAFGEFTTENIPYQYVISAEDVNAIGFSNIQGFIDKCQSMRITNASEWRVDWRNT